MSKKTYIALIRGINVSGKNKIKMPVLNQLFTNLGYTDVVTYIQSGNVVFKSDLLDTDKIALNIIGRINKDFCCDIKGMVINKKALDIIFKSNPFLKREAIDLSKLHVTLLSQSPNATVINQIKSINASQEDEFIVQGNCIYLFCPKGYGRTKLTNNMFEKKLNTTATTRNWRTVANLNELANKNN
ncbi:MAG: DUF1697 domain-containing protein [Flavobacteriaceae bacterium]|nr:DUF1697 domain-containing protein [Flavobacteriaceae bacterium]